MPVEFTCPECGSVLRIAAQVAAGQQVRCPKCKAVFRPPAQNTAIRSAASPSAPAPPAPAPDRAAPVSGTRPRPAREPDYHISDEDEFADRPRRRPGRKANSSQALLIGLLIGGGVFFLLICVAVLGAWFRLRSVPPGAPGVPVAEIGNEPPVRAEQPFVPPNLDQAVPQPAPLPPQPGAPPPAPPDLGPAPSEITSSPMYRGMMRRFRPNQVMILIISPIKNGQVGKYVADRLGPLLSNTSNSSIFTGTSRGVMQAMLAPTGDPQVVARKIQFGNVTRIDGRIIYVTVKSDLGLPPPDADPVTLALFDLTSPNDGTKKAAVESLGKIPPNDRKDEVVKALRPLLIARDGGLRNAAVATLPKWAGNECLPALVQLLGQKDGSTRQAAINALAPFREPDVAERIAERLRDFFDRGTASKVLQEMGAIAERPVQKYLTDTDIWVRVEACKILKMIGTADSVAALEQAAAKRDDGLVAGAAQGVLKAIAGRR